MRFYSRSTGCTYLKGIHTDLPEDAIEIPEQRYLDVIAKRPRDKVIDHDLGGLPILVDPLTYVPTDEALCNEIDAAADAARRAVAGDPLRAVEYDRAASEAQAFAAAGYQGAVPPMVAAWAINGRTAQQAADEILREAAQYNGALVQLRTTRLQAKELIRTAMQAGDVEQAKDIAAETIAAIEAAVAGIGNNT